MKISSRVGVDAEHGTSAGRRPSEPRKREIHTTRTQDNFYTVPPVCSFPAHANDEMTDYMAFSEASLSLRGRFLFFAVFSDSTV